MDKFTVEEINLICIFDTTSKNSLLSELRNNLSDTGEAELADIVNSTIGKLEHMTDEDYAGIDFFPAEEFEEMED